MQQPFNFWNMGDNEIVKKIKEPTSLSYIDEEKGFQLNIQSIDNIFEHISPEFELIKTHELKGSNYVWETYANKEALDKYTLLK